MWPYYLIFTVLALFAGFDRIKLPLEGRAIVYLSSSLVLVLFAGLRYNNADYFSYYNAFLEVVNGGSKPFADVGFNLILQLISYITSSPVIFLIIIAALSVGLNYNSFQKYSPYFFTAVLFYFVHNFQMKEMIQIRVGLASAICLYSIRFIATQRYVLFMLLFAIALSIHFSVLIWLCVPVFQYVKPTERQLLALLLFSVLMGSVYPFGQIIKSMTGLDQLDSRIGDYVAYGDQGYGSSMGVFTNLNAIKSIFFSLVYLILYHKNSHRLRIFYYPILCAYIIGTCWMLLFNDFAILSGRLSNILLSGEPILLSYVPLMFKRDSRWLPYLVFVLLALVMLYLNQGESKIEPYQFYYLR